MENPRQVVTGIVLRETETKETDKILTVLTPDLGKISVIAQGCRRKNSKIAASSQFLAYSEMTLYERGSWYYLQEASTKELFDGLRTDFEKLSLASFFADVVDAVSAEGTMVPEILSLLLNALYALSTLNKGKRLVKTAFTWRLLALIGFEPLLDGCAICGKEQVEQPMLDVQEGILHCKKCKEGNTISLSMSEKALEVLEYVLYGEAKKLYSFQADAETLRLLDYASEVYLMTQLERNFKTLDYYKSILIEEN